MKRKFIMGLMILSCVGCLLTGCGDDGETKESQGASSSHSSQTVQEQTSESTTSENTASENATSEETSETINTGNVGVTSEPQETPKPVVTVIPAQSSVTTPTVSNNTTEQTKPETSEEDTDDEDEASDNSESDTSESEDTNTPTDAEEDNDEPEKESDDDNDEEQPVNNNAWRNTVLTYTVDKDAWVIHKTNCGSIDVNADMETVRSRLTYLISANVHPETGEHLAACPNCLPDDTTHGDYDWERQVTRYVVDTDNKKIHEYNCECTLGTHQTVKSSISYLELHNVLFRCSTCFGNGSGSDSNGSNGDSNNDSDNDSDNKPSTGGSGLSGNVWISKYGNTYHSHSDCEYLKENGVEYITRESAEEKAFEPCEHCY